MKKAIIYARVSSRKQKDEETIDSQISTLLEFGHRQGFEISNNWIFLDNGVSGQNINRPGLDELRDFIKIEPIDAVLIYSPDRLARSYPHQLILMEEFRKHCIEVCFIKHAPQSNTPEAVMFNHFQGIFAEYERALILDRSRRGRVHKAKQGDPSILSNIAFGYIRKKIEHQTVIEIDKEKASIVKKIFKLYIYENYSLNQICRTLSESGVKSPKGGHWCRSSVVRILSSKTYIGTAFYGRTEKHSGKSDKIRRLKSGAIIKPKHAIRNRPEEEWFAINVPAIVSESDFELAQEKIKKNKELALRNTHEPSLLQGLVICGECGFPFYKKKRRKTGHYQCRSQIEKKLESCKNKKVLQEELDGLVYEEITKILQNPVLIKEELKRREAESQKIGETKRLENFIKKDLENLKKEQDRLLDAYQSGVFDLDTLRNRHQRLDKKRKDLENEKNVLQAIKLKNSMSIGWEKGFEKILEKLKKTVPEISMKEKQQLVRLLVDKIVIKEEEIIITHCVSPKYFSDGSGPLCCADLRLGVGYKRREKREKMNKSISF